MRPEITNDNTGKSSCHLAILMQPSILDILNVVIMMRMTYARFKQFYENVDMKMIRSIWSPWQKELGATAMKTETMPWQRPGSDNSLSDRCKRRCGCAEHAKDGGVIPVTGFPRDDGITTRRNME